MNEQESLLPPSVHALREELLREEGRLYYLIADAASDAIITIDQEGHILLINGAAERIFGYTVEEMIGQPITMLMPGFVRQVSLAAVERKVEAGRKHICWEAMPLAGVHRSGRELTLEISLVEDFRKDTRILTGIVRNIEDHHRAESLLDGQKNILELIARGTPLYEVLDLIARFIEQQSEGTFCSITLLDPNGAQLRAGACPSLPESFAQAVDGLTIGPQAGSCGTAAYLARQIISGDIASDPLWKDYADWIISNYGLKAAWSTPILSRDRKVLGTFAMYYRAPRTPVPEDYELIEISTHLAGIAIERKRADEALAAEKERLAVTLRSIAEGVIATDTDKKIVLMNRAAEELTGWTQLESFGRDLDEVFRAIDERSRSPRVAGDEASARGEILIARDGRERVIARSLTPMLDSENRPIGEVLVFRDITEQRSMEEEILRARKLESLGILAGGIAHDFNNLLTSVLASISLASHYADPQGTIHHKLKEAEQACVRAKGLTRQLVTFSKGGAPVRKTSSVESLIRESASFAVSGSPVSCEFDIDEDLWSVDIDEDQISQVIHNLARNAQQAMSSSGVVRIRAQNLTLKEGAGELSGRLVRISMADSGVGITEEHLGKIFDPYFTTKEKGSGLGLATAYSIIKNHDGHISVESQPGAGATFHIYLPASENAARARAQEASLSRNGKGHVLLMDDEPAIRKIVGEMLSMIGYRVEIAEDGAEALKLYKASLDAGDKFDLVIMDLTVPGGMGGRDAIGKLLEIDPEARAIVSSGYSGDHILSSYRDYGFCGVIVKPYRMAEMSQLLHNMLATGE